MKLEFLSNFADPAMQTPGGQGAFLAGIALGMVARGQVPADKIDTAPLFKQLNFGRLKKRDLKRHLARLPEIVKAYEVDYKDLIRALTGKAAELLMKDEEMDLGVDGNFAFAVAFMNAPEYFWTIFGKKNE